MARKVHYHPGQSEPCVVDDNRERSLSEWFLLIVCAVIAAVALWLFAFFVLLAFA